MNIIDNKIMSKGRASAPFTGIWLMKHPLPIESIGEFLKSSRFKYLFCRIQVDWRIQSVRYRTRSVRKRTVVICHWYNRKWPFNQKDIVARRHKTNIQCLQLIKHHAVNGDK